MDGKLTINDLPVGAKLVFGAYSVNGREPSDLTWIKVHNDNTFLSEYVIEQLAFDSREDGAGNGNPDYEVSNVRQFLNADTERWFVKSHEHDAPPEDKDLIPGFLWNFGDELDLIEKADVFLDSDYITDLVFLPSTKNLGVDAGHCSEQDVVWDYFDGEVSLRRCPSNDLLRLTRFGDDRPRENGWFYFTRTGIGNSVYCVDREGAVSSFDARDSGIGILPALRVSAKEELVGPSSSGYYQCRVKSSCDFVTDEELLDILGV